MRSYHSACSCPRLAPLCFFVVIPVRTRHHHSTPCVRSSDSFFATSALLCPLVLTLKRRRLPLLQPFPLKSSLSFTSLSSPRLAPLSGIQCVRPRGQVLGVRDNCWYDMIWRHVILHQSTCYVILLHNWIYYVTSSHYFAYFSMSRRSHKF